MNTKTQFIGMRDFRQNMADYVDKARKEKKRFIVMNRNKPLFEVKPFSDEDDFLESFLEGLREAEEDIRMGRVYTHEEVLKMLEER